MSAPPSEFERALLEVLKVVFTENCHIDTAIERYLCVHGIDEDDPGLWSELNHACNRLFCLIVEEGGYRGAEALKFLLRLGVARAIRSEISLDWSLCGAPSRADAAIRTFLHALRQGDPDQGLRWWRLYTMPWIPAARVPAALAPDQARFVEHG